MNMRTPSNLSLRPELRVRRRRRDFPRPARRGGPARDARRAAAALAKSVRLERRHGLRRRGARHFPLWPHGSLCCRSHAAIRPAPNGARRHCPDGFGGRRQRLHDCAMAAFSDLGCPLRPRLGRRRQCAGRHNRQPLVQNASRPDHGAADGEHVDRDADLSAGPRRSRRMGRLEAGGPDDRRLRHRAHSVDRVPRSGKSGGDRLAALRGD